MLDHICRGRSHILFHHRDTFLILFYKQPLKLVTYQMLHFCVFVNQFYFELEIKQSQKLVSIAQLRDSFRHHYCLIEMSNCYWC